MTRFWHPFSNMGFVQGNEVVLVRGERSTVYDREGRSYIDAAAGLWYANVGHGRHEIADAMGRQAATLAACSSFELTTSDRTLELADRLVSMVPVDDARIFFTSGGSDSVDTAAKVARRYWAALGKPEKRVVISRVGSYHGAHAFGTSIAGLDANREGFGDLVQDVLRVPRLDAGALADTIDAAGGERVAAFFAEPVMNPGVYPPGDYLADAARVCAEREVLFVADEVVTGFGRVGTPFGSERYGIRPDILTFAKGVTSGYAPLGGVAFSGRVAEPFWAPDTPHWLRHGYTYSGHATACAAGLANLDILEQEQLVGRVASLERRLATTFEPLLHLPEVTAVRSEGFMLAVQLDPELVERDPSLPQRAIAACRERGVLTRMLSGFAFQVSPPFVIEPDELELVAEAISGSVTATCRA